MLQKLENIIIIGSRQDHEEYKELFSRNHRQWQQKLACMHIIPEHDIDQNSYNELTDQLHQYRNNLIAHQHYISKLQKKALKSFENNIQISQYIRLIQRYFSIWLQQVRINLLHKLLFKTIVFKKLRKNREKKVRKAMKSVMIMAADNCYQKCLKLNIFNEWKLATKNQAKYKLLVDQVRVRNFKNFIQACQCKKIYKFTKQLTINIYREKKQKQYFNLWLQFIKITKIQKVLFSNRSAYYIKKFKKYYKFQKQTYINHYNKKLKSIIFNKLKLNLKLQKSSRFYEMKVKRKYFCLWLSLGSILFYQKQQENQNQQLANQFINRKNKLILLYSFERWSKFVKTKIENKKKNQVAKEYGEAKQKQYIITKFFNAMKQLKFYNKAQRFYQNKLKIKVINTLKFSMIKTAQKWQRLYNFVQERQKRKYFIAILNFNINERQKILKFKLKKWWNNFTFSIVKNYVQNNLKAEKYHTQSLKYRSFYVLKQQLNLKIKTNKVIIYLNANLNLRRWRKSHRIRQFVEDKQFVIKGKIFRQLKLMLINKKWQSQSNYLNEKFSDLQTQKKIGFLSSRNNCFTTQNSFLFDKISLQSPQRGFTLQYSISAYNSNANDNDNI